MGQKKNHGIQDAVSIRCGFSCTPRALKPRAMAADSGDGMCSISECSIDGAVVADDAEVDADEWWSATSGMAMRASAG